MSIHEEVAFDKDGKAVPRWAWREALRKVFLPLAVILVGLLCYGLGRLSGGVKPPVEIRYDPNIINALSGQAWKP